MASKANSNDRSQKEPDEQELSKRFGSVGEILTFEQFMSLKDFHLYVPCAYDLNARDKKKAVKLRERAVQAFLEVDFHHGMAFLQKSLRACVTSSACKTLAILRSGQGRIAETMYLVHLYRETKFKDEDEDLDSIIANEFYNYSDLDELYEEFLALAQDSFLKTANLAECRKKRQELDYEDYIGHYAKAAHFQVFSEAFDRDGLAAYFLLRTLSDIASFANRADYPVLAKILSSQLKLPDEEWFEEEGKWGLSDDYEELSYLFNAFLDCHYYKDRIRLTETILLAMYGALRITSDDLEPFLKQAG